MALWMPSMTSQRLVDGLLLAVVWAHVLNTPYNKVVHTAPHWISPVVVEHTSACLSVHIAGGGELQYAGCARPTLPRHQHHCI